MSHDEEGRWSFYDSWAAFPLNRVHETDKRIVGEFVVGLYYERGGTDGEFMIRFYDFSDRWSSQPPRIAARLEAFGDSWKILNASGLIQTLATLDGEVQTQDAVRTALLNHGMVDRTAKLRGNHPSSCPTCRGRGVLDEIESSPAPVSGEEA